MGRLEKIIQYSVIAGSLVWTIRTGAAPDYVAHVAALQQKLPSKDFTIVVQSPFVVVGDGGAAAVKASATHTVKWAVDMLKQDYFTNNPSAIIDVWLFRDKQSYEKHTEKLFGEKPSTPFGYYSTRHKALIMNISTGGGTLVHEIVHPFMEANFPDCPAWFNEGLGSLYEQCREVNGHIRGLTNWRLAALQEAIRRRKVPTFADLTGLSDANFYEGKNDNYAQARYMCYYLKERGLLVNFYHVFRARHAQDPAGYKTLQEVLGNPDMEKFQREWEQFVLKLRFP